MELESRKLRFSLAGMQLKLSMLRQADRLVLPVRGESGRYLVKIPGRELPDLAEVEAATLTWARRVGLSVPDHWVAAPEELQGVDPTQLGDPPSILVVERFDRPPDGRTHQEDFAQALGVRPADKYGPFRSAPTYDSLTRLVRDACGADTGATTDFIRRLAFMVASGNGDAHLKNWSFQWHRHHRPVLSPCYDLVATVSWPRHFGWETQHGPELALSLGKTKQFGELDRSRLRRFAERAEALDAVDVFMSTIEEAKRAWAEAGSEVPSRMRSAMIEHWRRVPLLREVGLPRSRLG